MIFLVKADLFYMTAFVIIKLKDLPSYRAILALITSKSRVEK